MKTFWLSYGGRVNSTALAILLCEGKLPQYQPWEAIFSNTLNEKKATYKYIAKVFVPYLKRHGKKLWFVKSKEGVLERWERLAVTGSRILRSCSVHAKIDPIEAFLAERAQEGDIQLIGIDADQPWRVKHPHPEDKWGKHFPLVDLNIDRAGCEKIIREVPLPIPPKSGCWHCPFMSVNEVMDLAIREPEKFNRIADLEKAATETHGPVSVYEERWSGQVDGNQLPVFERVIVSYQPRTQWGDKPAAYWMQRAREREAIRKVKQMQETLFGSEPDGPEIPCGCYDG